MSEVEGLVQGHRDGHGFVVRDDGQDDVYLSQQEMRAVLHRDRVKVRILRQDRKGRAEGRVLEILERKRVPIIGRLLFEGGSWVVAPEDQRYGQDILIPKNATASATTGQVVAIELTEPPSMYSQPVGRVIEVLGEIDDPGMEIEIAVRKYEVPHRFSPEALAQAASLPQAIRAQDRKHRVDLTDVPLVTIDGEDARDFDDAVYCEPAVLGKRGARGKGKGDESGWRLIVAIADVSHYVKPGEALDVDAYERATSVYFPRRVIPMLPERISNGLCSLNPDEDRLALVCDMLITPAGDVQAYQFYAAVIRSQARLTYDEVAAILGNTRGAQALRRDALVPHLLHLHGVYRGLLKAREKRGAVDFATSETQIVCDANGRIEKIVPRTRTEAHRLIEEAMLAANVCAADFIATAKHPALYRVHEGPTPERRLLLQNYLKALGLGLSVSDEPRPAEYQGIAAATRDRADATQIHTMLLRSMQQAIYTGTNSGHFGLAYDAYAHFTSPIRRYPDLLVHRVIHALLNGKRYHLVPPAGVVAKTLARKAAARPVKDLGQEAQVWEVAGAHCSANERRADEASRDVEAWLKCRYMREHLGEEFGGTVSSVAGFGLFVQLDALYVEGLVHITELGGEYFRFDEARQELRGERSGLRYAIGSRVRIQVSRVDLDGRRIDFRLVREGDAALPPPRGRRDRQAALAQSAAEELLVLKGLDREVKAATRRSGAKVGRAGKVGKAVKRASAAPVAPHGKTSGKVGVGGRTKAVAAKGTRRR
jgi:ribonuclease R